MSWTDLRTAVYARYHIEVEEEHMTHTASKQFGVPGFVLTHLR